MAARAFAHISRNNPRFREVGVPSLGPEPKLKDFSDKKTKKCLDDKMYLFMRDTGHTCTQVWSFEGEGERGGPAPKNN